MTLAAFLAVLISVESGGDDTAIGKRRERGALQIRAGVVGDVNRFSGTHYRHRDVHRRDVAIYCATVYLTHYVTEDRLGHKPTAEDYARVWNGGGNGWKKKSTIPYWNKVKREIERTNNEKR